MTGMLASVTSIAEAEIVLNEGVDIIDLKNPNEGALGALELGTLSNIVREINGIIPSSATVGDIDANDPGLLKTIYQVAETGVDIVKVGLFDIKPNEYFIKEINKAVEQGIRLVVVIFAEEYAEVDVYQDLLQTGITGIMLDTKNKTGRNLTRILHNNVLEKFIEIAKAHQLLSGMAGSLRYQDIEQLLRLTPDYLGFRGALCSDENRINQLDNTKVKKIREAIPRPGMMSYYQYNGEEERLKHGTVA